MNNLNDRLKVIQKDIIKVFFIMAGVALFHVLNTLILARNLSLPDMGLFRIVLTLSGFIFILSLLGMDASFIRFFSRESPRGYRWFPYVSSVWLFCAILATAAAVAAGHFYALGPGLIAAVVIATLLSLGNRFFTSLLRAQKYFGLATFLEKGSSLAFFILLAVFMVQSSVTLGNAIVAYLVSAGLAVLVIIRIVFKLTPSGPNPLPAHLPRDGLIFFGILVTTMAMLNANQLFIPKMLSYESLAVYAVTLSVMRIFELSVNALYFVFAPSLNNKEPVESFKIIAFLTAVGLGIGALYLGFGRQIIHFLFKSKYDEGAKLIPLFVGTGFCRLLYVFPASIVGGRAPQETLRRLFYCNCLAAGLGLVLNYFFILKWALEGAALATFYTWILATALGFWAVKDEMLEIFRQRRKRSKEVVKP